MRRRGILAALVALSGCLGGGAFDRSPDGTADETRSPTPTSTTGTHAPGNSTARLDVRVERFVETDRCPAPGDAAVRVVDADVIVTGCLRGATECTVPALSAVAYAAAADSLTVIVGTDAPDAPESDACATSLTALGYRVRVGLSDGPPSAVSVVHDAAAGHREVTRRTAADATTRPRVYPGGGDHPVA